MKRLRYGMLQAHLLVLLHLSLSPFAHADSDEREWIAADGTTFHASLLGFDPESGIVSLRDRAEPPFQRSISSLSAMDQAWVKEWTALNEEFQELRESMPGKFQNFQAKGEYLTDFHVYFPRAHSETPALPLLILFHPNGQGARYLNRFVIAAEEVGMIVVAPDVFRNTFEPEDEKEFDIRFLELTQAIDRLVPHDPKRIFMGGTSGGAARAFYHTVNSSRRWTGIWSNGGWLGPDKLYRRDYAPGLRVAMVNGGNDRAANYYVERDRQLLESLGATIKLFAFEGAHQVPPEFHLASSFEWLLGSESDDANGAAR